MQTVNAANFDEEVIKSEMPVLVDFYADWCGPCKFLSPILEEVETVTPMVKFVKINTDANMELAVEFKIRSIPTTILFKDGVELARSVGAIGKSTVEAFLRNNLKEA